MGSKTTSQVSNTPNPTATAAYNDVVGQAQSVASTPYQPYTGQLVAGLNGGQNAAIGQLKGAYGAAQPYVDEGASDLAAGQQGLGAVQPYLEAGSDADASAAGYAGLASGMFGQAASLGTPQQFSAAAVEQYESPYTQSVIDSTMANLNENDAEQSEQLQSSAMGSGAYGGDRSGVAQDELARQQDLANNQTVAGLESQDYSQALGQFNTTNATNLQAAGLLGSLGQGYTGLASNALQQGSLYGTLGQLQGTTGQAYGTMAGVAGNLGSTAQSNLISGASAGLQGSTLQQQTAQQQDTAAYNQYMAGLSYPYQNVGFLSNIVEGIGSQEGNTQTTQGNALSSIAGLGTSAIGILGATGGFGSTGYLSGLGSTISSAFSDARVKDDIASIGTTHDGQPIYRFRYKGDPKVQMGLMAQEVEKRDPGAVGEVGGIKTVDYDRATAGAAALGLGARPGDPRPQRATGGPVGLGMSPVGGPTMPMAGMGLGAQPAAAPAMAMAGAGLGARPRFDDGGAADASAAIPAGGITFNGVPGGGAAGLGAGGLNTSPTGLTAGGSGLNTGPGIGPGHPIQMRSGQGQQQPSGLGVMATSPSSALASGAAPAGGFGGNGSGSSGGLSQNAWLGVLSAGLGMMGGTSMSGLANIGQGAQQGLQTYLGLQQRDKTNAFQQQELALKKQSADSDAAFRTGTLAQGEKSIELKAQEMQLTAERQQQQLALESGNLANSTANTQSEVAARNAATAASRYSRTFIPGQGYMVTDLTDPTKPPQMVPMGGQGATPPVAPPGAGAPISFNSPTSSAPPPQGGVSTPSAAPVSATPNVAASPPASPSPPPATVAATQQPAALPSGSAGVAATPLASGSGATPTPANVGAGWKPTTSVPQGYVPPNNTAIYMTPGALAQQQGLAKDTLAATRVQAQSAGDLQMRLDEMDHQYAQLPKNGLLAPGQGAEARASLAKTVNQYATGVGMQPVFDPNAVAANENLVKDRFRLGADLAKGMGGREPGFIVQQAVKANPGADNTPMAYQRITAGLRQAAQYQQDRATFFDDYNARFGHLDGAQQAFDQANPPQAYANRAVVSTIDPRDVAALQQNPKNPAAAAAIDRKYGAGASAAIMGQ